MTNKTPNHEENMCQLSLTASPTCETPRPAQGHCQRSERAREQGATSPGGVGGPWSHDH